MKIKIGQEYHTDEEEFEITEIKDGYVTIEIKQYGNCFRKGRTFRLETLLEDIETGVCKINEKSKDAEYLFEELGFIEVKRHSSIKVYELDEKKNHLKKVVFDIVKKDYECYELYEAHHNTLEISIKLHKAITKQMEELGWLN